MTAIPTQTHVRRAVGLKEGPEFAAIAAGPIRSIDGRRNFFRTQIPWRAGMLVLATFGSAFSLLFRPREVLKNPPRYQTALELLFPGTAKFWSVAGGILLGLTGCLAAPFWPRNWSFAFYTGFFSLRQFPIALEPRVVFGIDRSGRLPFWWIIPVLALNAAAVLFWKWKSIMFLLRFPDFWMKVTI